MKHEEELRRIKEELGQGAFKKLIDEMQAESIKNTKSTCTHVWLPSQIAGDGYYCPKCKSTVLGDD